MAKINNQYDVGAAFEAIEDELMASMIRNMQRHKVEEIGDAKQWSMWQAEMLHSLEKYRHDNQKKFGKQFQAINSKITGLIQAAQIEGGTAQETKILDAIRKGFPAKQTTRGGTAEFLKINDRKLNALIEATQNDMQSAEAAVLRMANAFDWDPEDGGFAPRKGSYVQTADTEVVSGKDYYTESSGSYTKVTSPTKANLGTYYEKVEGSHKINVLVACGQTCKTVPKISSIYYFAPGAHTEGDGYLYQNRSLSDVFVFPNGRDGKIDSIYADVDTAEYGA